MMKRILIASLSLLGSSVLAGSHSASAEVRVNASITSGHSAIYFENQPDVVIVPGSRVYYYEAPSYDVYRYGNTWWVDRGGVWYRATSYHGPFARVSFERVPHQIVVVPVEYHRHDNGLHRGWEKNHDQGNHDQGHHEHGKHHGD
jgi:hypothetical protein